MSLPAFVPSIDAEMRATVIGELAGLERAHNVRILFAIESGSRAWGFPSPDSDYDARFVYAHTPDWYLSLQPGRDVIELPIDGLLDINGWDIRKALNLLLKPNPVMLEWLSSPIRYSWDDDVCNEMIDLANRTAHGAACYYHYRNLGEGQWRQHVGDKRQVNYKKYFYVLRPALAIRWVRLGLPGPPPMNLQALVESLNLKPAVVRDIAELLELKRVAREIGTGARMERVDALIRAEFDAAQEIMPKPVARHELRGEAEALFRRIVKGTA
jgi:uncharacterized protein